MSDVPIYPVSLKKIWLILNSLPPLLSKSEFRKRIEELTSPASAPLYIRALKGWNLVIETDHQVEVRKLQSFAELASLVVNQVFDEMGMKFKQILEDLMGKGISPKPELLYFYLRDKDISLWKITIALRLLRACGVFKRISKLEAPPETDEELVLRIISERGTITVEKLKEYLQRRYGFNLDKILLVLANLVLQEKVVIDPEPPKILLETFVEKRELPLRISINELPEITKFKELAEVENDQAVVKKIFLDDAVIYPR